MKTFAMTSILGLSLLALGCETAADQASRAVEQRVQEKTQVLVGKALGSVDKALQSAGSLVPKGGGGANLSADESLGPAGMAATSLHLKGAPEPRASVYLTFERAGRFTLEVRYLNGAGGEIGRKRQRIQARAGDGRFIEFPIDPRTRVENIHTVQVKRL